MNSFLTHGLIEIVYRSGKKGGTIMRAPSAPPPPLQTPDVLINMYFISEICEKYSLAGLYDTKFLKRWDLNSADLI